MSSDLALALALADVADSLSLAFRSGELRVWSKADGSPVTGADLAVERALRAVISHHRPQDSVFGEEGQGPISAAGTWVIDPIDGTRSFVRGDQDWATLISYCIEGTEVVSVVTAPELGRRWWAEAGSGAYADGRALKVSTRDQLECSVLAHSGQQDCETIQDERAIRLLRDVTATASERGGVFGHMLVAEGTVDVAIEASAWPWDVSAARQIVREAGGQLIGSPLWSPARGVTRQGVSISSNGWLSSQIDHVLGSLGTG